MAAGAELAAALAAEPEPMVRVAMAAQSTAVLDLCEAHGLGSKDIHESCRAAMKDQGVAGVGVHELAGALPESAVQDAAIAHKQLATQVKSAGDALVRVVAAQAQKKGQETEKLRILIAMVEAQAAEIEKKRAQLEKEKEKADTAHVTVNNTCVILMKERKESEAKLQKLADDLKQEKEKARKANELAAAREQERELAVKEAREEKARAEQAKALAEADAARAAPATPAAETARSASAEASCPANPGCSTTRSGPQFSRCCLAATKQIAARGSPKRGFERTPAWEATSLR
eukprot:COSAG04_NODE_4271_length_2194_cov_1.153699_1_plen_290_part_00